MKLTKEIIDLVEKRKECGNKLNHYDHLVHEWCDEHGVDLIELDRFNGCMLTTEPDNYARITLEKIEES